jgi:hypothetical protein
MYVIKYEPARSMTIVNNAANNIDPADEPSFLVSGKNIETMLMKENGMLNKDAGIGIA